MQEIRLKVTSPSAVTHGGFIIFYTIQLSKWDFTQQLPTLSITFGGRRHVSVVFEPSAGLKPIQLPSKLLTSQFDVVSINEPTDTETLRSAS